MTALIFVATFVLGTFTAVKCQDAGVCGGIFCNTNADCPRGQRCRPSLCGGNRCTGSITLDPCANFRCRNGGTCTAPADRPTCQCPPGFVGDRCQRRQRFIRDPCAYFRCRNGGTCTAPADRPYCECPPGFAGDRCELRVSRDPCANFRCANGGSCTAPADAPYCLCPEGFTGTRCETRIGRPGSCPINKPGTVGVCGAPSHLWCSSDDECGIGQKCCRNPCGTPTCTNVGSSVIRRETEKPGKCPKDLISICIDTCINDASCPGNQKCCQGCGTTCADPVY